MILFFFYIGGRGGVRGLEHTESGSKNDRIMRVISVHEEGTDIGIYIARLCADINWKSWRRDAPVFVKRPLQIAPDRVLYSTRDRR